MQPCRALRSSLAALAASATAGAPHKQTRHTTARQTRHKNARETRHRKRSKRVTKPGKKKKERPGCGGSGCVPRATCRAAAASPTHARFRQPRLRTRQHTAAINGVSTAHP
eukprot:1144094-Rhodomonas_salina.1